MAPRWTIAIPETGLPWTCLADMLQWVEQPMFPVGSPAIQWQRITLRKEKRMLRLWEAFNVHFAPDEDGASMVEYALLVSLIAIVALVAVALFGTSLSTEFKSIADTI
jgi:pilus assembly protein Flp/PilA